jgi:hypothetical protein
MKTIGEIETELQLKEQRVAYWEKYHSVPTMNDLEMAV